MAPDGPTATRGAKESPVDINGIRDGERAMAHAHTQRSGRLTAPEGTALSAGAMRWLAAAVAAVAIAACWLAAPRVLAAPPVPFAKFCGPGEGAGECLVPRGVAVDPATGHVFMADMINNRVQEFNPWGELVKAWGWGVRTGAAAPETCTSASGCRAGDRRQRPRAVRP